MIEIHIRNSADWTAFEEKLDNLEELGNEIGVSMKAASQKAFEDQGFDDGPGWKDWPYRYKDSRWDSDPFINVAGAVAELMNGPRVSENNFERRPALKHHGTLRDSLTFQVAKSEAGITVNEGTNSPYAEVSQLGGPTKQDLTDTFKKNLNTFLEKKNVRKKQPLKRGALGPKEKDTPGSVYAEKLEPLMREEQLTTFHWARPFVGFGAQTKQDVIKLTEEFFSEE